MDLYTNLFIETIGVAIDDLELEGTGTVTTWIRNAGTTFLNGLDWEIRITGDSPIGRFMFLTEGQLLYELLRGRIISGGYSSDVTSLSLGESEKIGIGSMFGIGHITITVTVSLNTEVLAEKSEDGFLLGGRLLLFYPEE